MNCLMDIYDIVSKEDKLLLDDLFIRLINHYDYKEYKKMYVLINKKYNKKYMFYSYTVNENTMQIDFDKYLTLYFEKYKNSKKEIYSDPITLELIANPLLYNKYVRTIVNIDEINCFEQIKKNDIQKKYYPNYNNNYYIELMMDRFKKIILRNGRLYTNEVEEIIKFFIKKEAHDENLIIDFKLVKLTDYFKELLNKNERRLALQKINEYGITGAYYTKKENNFHHIFINISNYKGIYSNDKITFFRLLKTIYHECRHALQSSGKIPILSNIDQREQVILNYDYKYYNDNHQFFEVEVDAKMCGLEKISAIYDNYFREFNRPMQYTEEKSSILTDKYLKRLELENKVDAILLKHPECLTYNLGLQEEYLNNGHPKGIVDILNQRINNYNVEYIIVYNEMIVRALNRMNENELFGKLTDFKNYAPLYFQYIEEAVNYQINEISKVYNFINTEYQRKNLTIYDWQTYQSKMSEYNKKMQYYHNQINMIKGFGVAKR